MKKSALETSTRKRKASRNGAILGAALGIVDNTLFDVMVSNYRKAGYTVETGSCGSGNDAYMYMETTSKEDKMQKEDDRSTCVIHYFNGEGTQITELKVLREVVTDVVIEKNGKYVM